MKSSIIKTENGFTLLEMIVSIIILGILGVIAVSIIANQTESFNQVVNQTVGLTDSRKVVRMLRSDIQNLTVANIITKNGDQFEFTDNDGTNISYQKTGSEFTRNENLILTGLDQSPFTYLNIDQQTTSTTDSIKFIGVSLSIVINNESVVMEEIIYARN